MKAGTLAQVHRKGIKAGHHDQCFKGTELSSKEIRLWTSTDSIHKDTEGPSASVSLLTKQRLGKW